MYLPSHVINFRIPRDTSSQGGGSDALCVPFLSLLLFHSLLGTHHEPSSSRPFAQTISPQFVVGRSPWKYSPHLLVFSTLKLENLLIISLHMNSMATVSVSSF
jgi:hypothetical protein